MAIYIFGYGSLINMAWNATEIKNAKERTFWPVLVTDLQRSFNAKGTKYTALNVTNVKGSTCNGIIFKVNAKELQLLKIREAQYTLKPIHKTRLDFVYGAQSPLLPADKVFCFYALAAKVNKAMCLLNKNYVKICLDGCAKISATFLADFVLMTVGWDCDYSSTS
jgi:hypothetical protein